jgi:diguanylate cyclase (GGDEF)-like protein
LGVIRLISWAMLVLAAGVGFAWSEPARARPLALAPAACVGGADSAEAAFGIDPAELECSGGKFSLRDRFVRGRVELARIGPPPPDRLIWQTDPTSFDSMLVRLDYADGTQRLIDVDGQMAVRNWDANGNFWVPIQQDGSALTAIDVVVERPQSDAVFRRMTLSGFDDAAANNYSRTLLYVLVCGALLVPIIYDLLFFRVLRARFMLWHLAMTAGTLFYVLFNSGLILVMVPDMPSLYRYAGIYLFMSITISGLARFSVLVVEEGTVPARLRQALIWAAIANLAIAMLIPLNIEALRMRVIDLYMLSVLPVIAALVAVLAIALRRGSRTAVFLTAAYAGLIVAGAAQVFASLGSIAMADLIDESIYVALVILVLGTSAGVGDRFLVIKSERDRARLTARKLGAMANSDGLTGLLNRRAFDQNRRLMKGRGLLVIDIDRFKAINDTYGHQRGDAALCHAARVIEQVMAGRPGGQVFRLGGEEFAVLCEAADEAALAALSETIRSAMELSGDGDDAFDVPNLTISIGAVLGEGQLMHVAFAEADGALYRAKQGGRNRCEIARPGFSYA